MRPRDRCVQGWIILGLSATAITSTSLRGGPPVFCDFNGDGYADLAAASADEDDNGYPRIGLVGAVNVIYGSQAGLTAEGNQYWHQDSPDIQGVCDGGEQFGYGIASGDFNGDGFADLVAGAPGDVLSLEWDSYVEGGSVSIIYGSEAGLTATGNELLNQKSPGVKGRFQAQDHFGQAVAVGDFDGDGFDDVLVGIPSERTLMRQSGAAQVLYGSTQGVGRRNALAYQGYHGRGEQREYGDHFGAVVAAGDFNGDGFDDAVIGAPDEDSETFDTSGSGHLTIVYGSSAGLRLDGFQQADQETSGIPGDPEYSGGRDMRLATGDFNGDGFEELAVGLPNAGRETAYRNGLVLIFAGTPSGLKGAVNQVWKGETAYPMDYHGDLSSFGAALCAADFDGDGKDDLAIGMPDANDLGLYLSNTGALIVMWGTARGLTSDGSVLFTQNTDGMPEESEKDDFWGSALGAGDFDGNGCMDLVIGARSESVETAVNAGAATVLYGSPFGLRILGAQLWHQGIEGILGRPSSSDNIDYRGFGDALCTP